ncbi:MAG: AAA family ATPase [Gloeobacteraceae cyanobacterium ES-bin-316]|nr:AAA family ATPase [Ferruginibacter sp.]
MQHIIIGREQEQQILGEILNTKAADMLAITGRRRVGKTYLVRSYFAGCIHFEMNGILNATTQQQLHNFDIAFNNFSEKKSRKRAPASNWLEAFHRLAQYLESLKTKKKLVVFIDELPWLDTHRSGVLPAFDWFWNSWAVKKNILVIICGSASSWMTSKIINNRGGLHNRVTKRIHLQPFNLSETEAYLNHINVHIARYQVLQLYMALGGIPHYLKEVKRGQSATQNINRICFEKTGLLVNEFDNLYNALFVNARQHIGIIQALASKNKGLSRAEILTATKLADGGSFSKLLIELEQSDFISAYLPFNKLKKETIYRLTDEYSLFYLKFMRGKKNINWLQLAATPSYKAWSGYAFENICMKHIEKIKQALGIAAVYTEVSSIYYKGDAAGKGAQIDMLIDRQDSVINACEAKFSDKPFTITKAYADDLRKKLAVFQQKTGTRKTLFLTFITPYGLVQNQHSIDFVQQEVAADNLF